VRQKALQNSVQAFKKAFTEAETTFKEKPTGPVTTFQLTKPDSFPVSIIHPSFQTME
jgi:hypothetical protein